MESELLVAAMIGGNSARFEVAGSFNQYWVIRFSGVEAVSELFEFQIEVTSRFVQVDELVGALARLRLAGVDRRPREIHGLICRAEYTGEMPPRSLYRITLVPELWRLQFRTNSRIFQQMTTPDILTKLLAESGIRHQLRLAGAYAPRDYCVQYRESDLAFVRRLMEEDGIAFYFEHAEEQHTLVLSDSNTGRVPIEGDPALAFRPHEQVRGDDSVRLFSLGHQITPGAVVVRDFDLHVTQDLDGRSQARSEAQLELYDAPIGARSPAVTTTQAKIRLEAARVPGILANGTSDCPRLVPGHSFTLTGHLRHELNSDYHVIRLVHRGEQPRIVYADAELVYDNDFVAIPVETPYRPPRTTPRPMIRGVQTATVVGPAGEEIFVDEQARVKVQFHWDRDAPYSEASSCWVRVSQAWAGTGFGAMFIPRIGHEVLVEFIEGDPNRPIITGRIYDGTRTPPYPLPDEKTKSTIKSESSPGGGGFNELRFEDAKGVEEIFVHAQFDMNTVVLHDDSLAVGNSQSEDIGVDRRASVGNNEAMTVGIDQSLEVGQDQTNTIGQNRSSMVGADQRTTIGANHTTLVTGGQDTVVGGDQTNSVSGHRLTVAGMDHALAVGGDQHVQVQGNQTLEIGVDQVITVLGDCSFLAGMMVDATVGTDAIVSIGANHTLMVGGERFAMIGGGDTLTVAGALTISAATITLTAGDSSITIAPGAISISTGGTVAIDGSLATVNMGMFGSFF